MAPMHNNMDKPMYLFRITLWDGSQLRPVAIFSHNISEARRRVIYANNCLPSMIIRQEIADGDRFVPLI